MLRETVLGLLEDRLDSAKVEHEHATAARVAAEHDEWMAAIHHDAAQETLEAMQKLYASEKREAPKKPDEPPAAEGAQP